MKRSKCLAVIVVFSIAAGARAQIPDGGPIASGQTLSGTLDVASDTDIYRFEGHRGDRVLIEATWTFEASRQPQVELYPPKGGAREAVAAYPYGSLNHVLAQDGTYTIVIESDYYTGGYSLTLVNLRDSLVADHDLDGGTILSGQTIEGTMDIESDLDAYRFEGRGGDRVLIRARWMSEASRHPQMALYPPNGGAPEAVAAYPYGSLDLALAEDGIYTLVVDSDYYTGDYNLTLLNLQESLISDEDPDGGAISSDQTIRAKLNVKSDMDAYRFEGGMDDRVRISAEWTFGASRQPQVRLYPPHGGGREAEAAYPYGFVDHGLEQSGTYTIVIDSEYYVGNYNLTFYNITRPPPLPEIYVDAGVHDPSADGSAEHPFDRIQTAIDVALDGMTVIVKPGIYAGGRNRNLTLNGKAITIRSLDPNDPEVVQSTIIACESVSGVPHRAFSFLHGEDASTVLEGVTIEGGAAEMGGAIFCKDSSPTVRGCIIQGCEAYEYGGAIYCEESAARIVNCDIRQNSARKTGGGIYLGTNCSTTVSSCTLTGNNAGQSGGGLACEFSFFGNSLIDDCTIERNSAARDGGGVYVESFRSLSLVGCDISDNSCRDRGGGLYVAQTQFATCIEDCRIVENEAEQGSGVFFALDGSGSTVDMGPEIQVERNDWFAEGDGFLSADRSANVTLHECTAQIACNVQGPCTLAVGPYSELHFEGDASVDLGPDSATDEEGHIVCEGLLRLADNASLRNARVQVTRASFEDNAIIDNCVVNAEAGAPYGQFFIEDSVSLSTCHIEADGDRYLDLDPRTFDWANESIRDIWIDVLITEGQGTDIGGLFELRGLNGLVETSCGEDEFVCQIREDGLPEFARESWTIDTLRLAEGAKLNLTNRFEFQTLEDDSDSHDEVLYVKNLVLEPDSVLNTGFHRVYCANLHQDPTAQIVHVPLLGFSLNNISFDDQVDYATRIESNNLESDDPGINRIHVERIAGNTLDPCGVMVMRNVERVAPDDPQGAEPTLYHARAKALFAKSSEDQILIQFEYAFDVCSPTDVPDPTAELIVYLSDVPQLLDAGDASRAEHYVEVARIPVPAPGRPGSIGSGRLAVFEAMVSKGELDFLRGTRMELELVGPAGMCVYINDWDPLVVQCSGICMDVTGDGAVLTEDLLTLVGELGSSSRAVRAWGGSTGHCLEGPFSLDGFVDTVDMAGWAWMLNMEARRNLCGGIPLVAADAEASAMAYTLRPASKVTITGGTGLHGLLVVGKKAPQADLLNPRARLVDGFYRLDSNFQYTGMFRSEPDSCTVRLVQDLQGHVYRINCETGVWRFGLEGHDECVLPPGSGLCAQEPVYKGPATVYVGIQDRGSNSMGRPVLDVAFGANSCFVVPVVVAPEIGEPYVAAAELKLSPDEGSYEVVQVLTSSTPWEDPETLREIEIDRDGNVYVLCAYNGDDVLWRYEPSGDAERYGLVSSEIGCDVVNPVAMRAAKRTGKLYLASAYVDAEEDAPAQVFEFSMANPMVCVRTISVAGMQHITDLTEDPATESLIVGGFAMDYGRLGYNRNVPAFPSPFEPAFYSARLARVPPGQDVVNAQAPSGEHDLVLPLSLVWAVESEN